MKHNKIDRVLFQDIGNKFSEFKNINRLAKHYRVDNATIKNILIEFKIDVNFYKEREDERKKEAVDYYRLGNSLAKCCARFDLTWSKLTRVLKKLNLLRVDSHLNLSCKLCKIPFNNKHALSKHLRDVHKTSPKQYYNTFYKKDDEGYCVICGNETTYIGIIAGYKPTCSHICGAKFHRQKLKTDSKKYQNFVKTVSSNMKDVHANMSTEEKNRRSKNASETLKKINENLTDEQRKQKYGWLNRLSEEEKLNVIQTIITQTGCHKWWKTTSEKEKIKVFEKRSKTKLQKRKKVNICLYRDFLEYRRIANRLTEQTYKKFKHEINPNNFYRKKGNLGYHLDHKYSVFQGFVDGIPADIISCKYNLQVIPGSENIKKSISCSITKEELLLMYEKKF